jgi:hypothetical protein
VHGNCSAQQPALAPTHASQRTRRKAAGWCHGRRTHAQKFSC